MKRDDILHSVASRQGLVCYDPESFFQNQNKNPRNSLCVLRALAVQQ